MNDISISNRAFVLLSDSMDWAASIEKAVAELKKDKPNLTSRAWAIELVHMALHACRDTSHAIVAALWSHQADTTKIEILCVANDVVSFVGDPQDRSKIARLIARKSLTHGTALDEALAWLDCGKTGWALLPLLEAQKLNSTDLLTNMATLVAKCEWPDLRQQVELFKAKAKDEQKENRSVYLWAAFWILQLIDPESNECDELLKLAYASNPCLLLCKSLETRLSRGGMLDVVTSCEMLANVSPPDLAYRLRWLGLSSVIENEVGTGSKFELSLITLKEAYQGQVAFLPGHLVLLQHLVESALLLKRARPVLAILELGLGLPLSPFELGFIALQGLKLDKSIEVFKSILALSIPEHPEAIGALPLESFSMASIEELESEIVSRENLDSNESMIPGLSKFDTQVFSSSMIDNRNSDVSLLENVAFAPEHQMDKDIFEGIPAALMENTGKNSDEKNADIFAGMPGALPSTNKFKKNEPSPLELKSILSEIDVVPETYSNTALKESVAPSHLLIPRSALKVLEKETKKREAKIRKKKKNGARRAKRISYAFDARIVFGDQKFLAIVRDMSETGVFLVTSCNAGPGSRLNVEMTVSIKGNLRHLVLDAEVVRMMPHGLGCRLKSPPIEYIKLLSMAR